MDSEAASMEMEEEEAPVKKHELVRQLQFPRGFRFVPTEEELVDLYLRGKIEGRKLPLDVINEVSILEWQPGKLVETYKAYGENKWYFFTKRIPSSSNKEEEANRKVNVPGVSATWKASGRLMVIRRKGKPGDKIGTKRVLIYHSSDAEEDGHWSMHEYILSSNSKIGQYALYSIQRKQRSNKEPGMTRKRKKAASAQQQKQETMPPHPPPLTPLQPQQADHLTPQQGSAPSLQLQQQGCPSDGNQQLLEVSAPMSAGHVQTGCYDQQGGYDDMAAQLNMQLAFGNQGEQEQPPSLMWNQPLTPDNNVYDAQYHHQVYQTENYGSFGVPPNQPVYDAQYHHQQQLYQMENGGSLGVLNQLAYKERYLRENADLFPPDTSTWGLGQDQLYQQGGGDAIGVQDPHGFQSYCELPQGHGAVLGQETAYGSHDQFTTSFEGAAVASEGVDSIAAFFTDVSPTDFDLLFSNWVGVDDLPSVMPGGEQDGGDPGLQDLQGQQTDNAELLSGPGPEFLSCIPDV